MLAFFTLHQTITDDNVESAASLIDEWAHRIARRTASGDLEDGIDEEHRRWIDGEL